MIDSWNMPKEAVQQQERDNREALKPDKHFPVQWKNTSSKHTIIRFDIKILTLGKHIYHVQYP